MATAQGLRATHGVSEGVMSIGNDLQDVGGGVRVAINRMGAVLDGTRHVFFWLSTSSSNLWLAGENMRGELQQVARNISDLANDAEDDKRS